MGGSEVEFEGQMGGGVRERLGGRAIVFGESRYGV